MERKVVFWKRFAYKESGYKVLEICDDGTALLRTFENQKDEDWLYKEVDQDETPLQGKILIEHVDFGEDGKIKAEALPNKVKTMETYELKDFASARDRVQTRQNLSLSTLKEDYHSILVLEPSSIPEHIKNLLPDTTFPIIKFRYENDNGVLLRKEKPRRLETRFIPELNETIYFYLDTGQENLTTTGDNIFSIDTKHCEPGFCETDFDAYIQDMVKDMKANLKQYHDLFVRQRNRMAMLDTDVIGDLYPR